MSTENEESHMLNFTLNATDYEVAEYHGGWSWLDVNRNEESLSFFATPLEAQQDAIKWEAGRGRREENAEEEERERLEAANDRGTYRKPRTPW
ncbi:hypothetical protein J8F10_09080 [Gemmata sp. G18]|uniref:DUF2188 domain-containing protein n=1 Tax=Gemmata palustris TaxID=2822762 RepID=A0ABS5BP13_9BACT|nr:hypothetical protein [Gemmata palustris]MBP3955433.1 hypothetical protein [Gemmata palustris]